MGGGTLGDICPATASSCDHCPILKLTDSSHMLCSTLMIQNIRQHHISSCLLIHTMSRTPLCHGALRSAKLCQFRQPA